MHYRSTRCICFKRKCFSAEPLALHLLGIKLLNVFYESVQFCINAWLSTAVSWEEVDEPYHFALLQRLQIGFYILETDGAIIATTHESCAVWGEICPEGPTGMSCQRNDFCATFNTPESDRGMTRAGERFAVR